MKPNTRECDHTLRLTWTLRSVWHLLSNLNKYFSVWHWKSHKHNNIYLMAFLLGNIQYLRQYLSKRNRKKPKVVCTPPTSIEWNAFGERCWPNKCTSTWGSWFNKFDVKPLKHVIQQSMSRNVKDHFVHLRARRAVMRPARSAVWGKVNICNQNFKIKWNENVTKKLWVENICTRLMCTGCVAVSSLTVSLTRCLRNY